MNNISETWKIKVLIVKISEKRLLVQIKLFIKKEKKYKTLSQIQNHSDICSSAGDGARSVSCPYSSLTTYTGFEPERLRMLLLHPIELTPHPYKNYWKSEGL